MTWGAMLQLVRKIAFTADGRSASKASEEIRRPNVSQTPMETLDKRVWLTLIESKCSRC